MPIDNGVQQLSCGGDELPFVVITYLYVALAGWPRSSSASSNMPVK
jgi:hypothetical protein